MTGVIQAQQASLADRIRAIERRYSFAHRTAAKAKPRSVVPTGWPIIDDALEGGLIGGALHEWLGIAAPTVRSISPSHKTEPRAFSPRDRSVPFDSGGPVLLEALSNGKHERSWTPPLVPLVHLAWQFLNATFLPMHVVWIGERCFPYPRVLVRGEESGRRLLECSLFIMPRNANDRLWATDLALRSPVVGLVVADGSRFDMTATRRVQLVAKAHGTAALIVRPHWECVERSAAETRWMLTWEAPSPSATEPRWNVELLRCKGVQPDETHHRWVLEWNRASCTLNLSTQVARSESPAEAIASVQYSSRYRQQSA